MEVGAHWRLNKETTLHRLESEIGEIFICSVGK